VSKGPASIFRRTSQFGIAIQTEQLAPFVKRYTIRR